MQPQNANSGKSSTATKWLIGLGIGCGVVILLLVLVGVGGFLFVKNIVQEFEETENLMDTLTERYGRIQDFCPDPYGTIRPERIEAFLTVRNSMTPVKENLEKSIDILSDEKREDRAKEEPRPHVLTKVKTGLGIIPLIAEFVKTRNQALLDAEMGIGEYYFIYVVVYYSWLRKSPVDGPPFQLVGEDEEERGIFWRRRRRDTMDLEDRLDYTLKRLHRQLLPMLQNQYKKLTGPDVSPVIDPWREALMAEIEAMEFDRFRLPWQDGLPEVLEASFEPFRERLEASYSTLLNPLEVALEQR